MTTKWTCTWMFTAQVEDVEVDEFPIDPDVSFKFNFSFSPIRGYSLIHNAVTSVSALIEIMHTLECFF